MTEGTVTSYFIPRSSNGRTAAFEAVNLGSIPSLGTRKTRPERSVFSYDLLKELGSMFTFWRVKKMVSCTSFVLIFFEEYPDKCESFRIEKFYKSASGKCALKKKIIAKQRPSAVALWRALETVDCGSVDAVGTVLVLPFGGILAIYEKVFLIVRGMCFVHRADSGAVGAGRRS
jgi:hypothetical protein